MLNCQVQYLISFCRMAVVCIVTCACLLINRDKTKMGVSLSKRFAQDFAFPINRWLSWQICLSYRSTFGLKNAEYDTYVINASLPLLNLFLENAFHMYLIFNKSLNALELHESIFITGL